MAPYSSKVFHDHDTIFIQSVSWSTKTYITAKVNYFRHMRVKGKQSLASSLSIRCLWFSQLKMEDTSLCRMTVVDHWCILILILVIVGAIFFCFLLRFPIVASWAVLWVDAGFDLDHMWLWGYCTKSLLMNLIYC